MHRLLKALLGCVVAVAILLAWAALLWLMGVRGLDRLVNATMSFVTFGLWFAALLIAPLMIRFAQRRASRAPPGHCSRCRYNLSGLPAGVACPECGGRDTRVPPFAR